MLPATAVPADLAYLASRHGIAPFQLHRPASVAEAGDLLVRHAGAAAPMAGGVDLVNALKRGERIRHVVYLCGIAELCRVECAGGVLRVGAAVTHQQVADDPTVATVVPDLAAVWRRLGNPRVRAAGTLGGNLTTGAAHYDVPPLVASVGARLRYHDDGGLLLGIDFPLDILEVRYESAYKPIVSVAVTWLSSGRIRIAVGCAYPKPAVIDLGAVDGRLDPAQARDLATDAVRSLPTPLEDHISSAAYRRRLIEVIMRRMLTGRGDAIPGAAR